MKETQLKEQIPKELPATPMQKDDVSQKTILEANHQAWIQLTMVLDKLEQRLDQKIEEDHKKWKETQRRWEKYDQQMEVIVLALQVLNQQLNQKIEEDRQYWTKYRRNRTNDQSNIKRLDQKVIALGTHWGINSSEY